MIDAHCHIDLYNDPLFVAKKADNEGIITVAVTTMPEHFNMAIPFLEDINNIHIALGFHPSLAGKRRFNENLFKSLSQKTSYIGEIGLDFSNMYKFTKHLQIDILRKILTIIVNRPRFISIHSRNAEQEVLYQLNEFRLKKVVFHWYSGPLFLIEEIIKLGHFFSINPAMIKSPKGRILIERINPDRIVTESDGPYVRVKGIPAQPKDTKMVLEFLRIIWSKTLYEVENLIHHNFDTLVSDIGSHDV